MSSSLYWGMAVHDPSRLHQTVLENSLTELEAVKATEMLALLANKQEALFYINVQLLHDSTLIVEAAIFAIRIIYATSLGFSFSTVIRDTLVYVATSHKSEFIRKEAAECLADLTFDAHNFSKKAPDNGV